MFYDHFSAHSHLAKLGRSPIPGVDNPAHKSSRVFNEQFEWQLDRNVFGLIIFKFGEPKIDQFASRINNQLPCYVSWKPEPGATHVNAFSFLWTVLWICISSFQFDWSCSPEDQTGRSYSTDGGADMD